jgi:hypothetical protein
MMSVVWVSGKHRFHDVYGLILGQARSSCCLWFDFQASAVFMSSMALVFRQGAVFIFCDLDFGQVWFLCRLWFRFQAGAISMLSMFWISGGRDLYAVYVLGFRQSAISMLSMFWFSGKARFPCRLFFGFQAKRGLHFL